MNGYLLRLVCVIKPVKNNKSKDYCQFFFVVALRVECCEFVIMEQSNESKAISLNWNWNLRLIDILTGGHYSYSTRPKLESEHKSVSRVFYHHRQTPEQSSDWVYFLWKCNFIHNFLKSRHHLGWKLHHFWIVMTLQLQKSYIKKNIEIQWNENEK